MEHNLRENLREVRETFSKVLLVEDEPAHALLIKRALSKCIDEVKHVPSGGDALRELTPLTDVDLIVCDLKLPDMSGIDILRAIKQLPIKLPVVVLTSSSSTQDAVQAMSEGAWDYVVKGASGDADGLQLVLQRAAQRFHREQEEKQLQRERQLLAAAANAAMDGLAILGDGGIILIRNQAFETFSDALTANVECKRNIIQLLGSTNPQVAESFREQLESGSASALRSTELHVAGPNDTEKYYELTLSSYLEFSPSRELLSSIAPLKNYFAEENGFRRSVLWVRDITRRKSQEKFQRDLLSTTSHDLKGPLGAILNSAELLSEIANCQDVSAQHLVTGIASCARNCINIIDEFLSARRIQDGVFIVRPRTYEVGDILEDCVLDFLPMAKSKNITLTAKDAKDIVIYADKLALSRVLSNLVGNAIKFTPSGGHVELSASSSSQGTSLTISDTGQGIDPSSRHKLFEKYSRLEEHQEIEGTGLGLFVTKNILEAHNGHVEVWSERGVGSRFTVTFPHGSGTSSH